MLSEIIGLPCLIFPALTGRNSSLFQSYINIPGTEHGAFIHTPIFMWLVIGVNCE